MFVKVKVHEIEYSNDSSEHPLEFEFDILDSIVSEDRSLADEVMRLIKENTGSDITGCSIDVE